VAPRVALADSLALAIRFRTQPLRLGSSIPSAVVDFVNACNSYVKNCLLLIFMFILKFYKKKLKQNIINHNLIIWKTIFLRE